MLEKDYYKNGQIVHELKNSVLTYYYKNGVIKARGPYINDMMEDEWHFYYDNGILSQIGHFKHNLKHGRWVRYTKDSKVNYDKIFIKGKEKRH
jgi:antitoxin component YwqK of YwqJK toxin-antitoxin module